MDNEKQKFLNEFRKSPLTIRVPIKWKDDKEVVLAAVRHHGYALHDASARLKDDKDIILTAVRFNGSLLSYAFARPRDDKEVVLTAVRQKGHILDYASKRLQNDKEVVEAALTSNIKALIYCNFMVLPQINLSLFTMEQRERMYLEFSKNSSEDDIFLLAKTKRHFLS